MADLCDRALKVAGQDPSKRTQCYLRTIEQLLNSYGELQNAYGLRSQDDIHDDDFVNDSTNLSPVSAEVPDLSFNGTRGPSSLPSPLASLTPLYVGAAVGPSALLADLDWYVAVSSI